MEFIQDLHAIGVPFIIVLTQCYAAKSKINEFVDIINKTNREKGMSDISVVKVLAQDFSVEIGDSVLKVPSYGLNDLVNKTLKELPAFIKSGFAAAQKISKSEKRTACEEIIYEYICAAKYGFWDKVPLINVFTTDKKIFNMFKKIGQLYNTVLKEEDIKKITQGAHIDFKNAFWGLVAPVDLVGYNRKIADLLQSKKEDGFNVYYEHFTNNERAARMIAFYGYTFIDSIEELWEKSTEEELKKVDIVVEKLIEIINRNLSKRENEYRQSRR